MNPDPGRSAGWRPGAPGVRDGRLRPCPARPNCVCSDDTAPRHRIAPLRLRMAPARAWSTAREVVQRQPRTTAVTVTESYLHAECRSRLLGLVDHLELHLRPADGIIAVRSASRLGYGDHGVNRQRVEDLRSLLAREGVVQGLGFSRAEALPQVGAG